VTIVSTITAATNKYPVLVFPTRIMYMLIVTDWSNKKHPWWGKRCGTPCVAYSKQASVWAPSGRTHASRLGSLAYLFPN
jgi:hypothetical protein